MASNSRSMAAGSDLRQQLGHQGSLGGERRGRRHEDRDRAFTGGERVAGPLARAEDGEICLVAQAGDVADRLVEADERRPALGEFTGVLADLEAHEDLVLAQVGADRHRPGDGRHLLAHRQPQRRADHGRWHLRAIRRLGGAEPAAAGAGAEPVAPPPAAETAGCDPAGDPEQAVRALRARLAIAAAAVILRTSTAGPSPLPRSWAAPMVRRRRRRVPVPPCPPSAHGRTPRSAAPWTGGARANLSWLPSGL